MAISKGNRNHLTTFLKDYFANNRTSSAFEIVVTLQEENNDLLQILNDANAKMNTESYLTRYILPKLKNDGWLSLIDDQWRVQLSPDRCSCCFKPIDQIYIIDIDLNRYCSWNCTEKCYYFTNPYENNLDLYSNLYDQSETVLSKCISFQENRDYSHKQNRAKLDKMVRKLDSMIHDPDYSEVLRTNGTASCIDAEIYRMLLLLEQECQRLPDLLSSETIKVCVHCSNLIDEKFIVNQDGKLFCSDNCLENSLEKNLTNYEPHPYEDQYLLIRSSYIDIFENWEQHLSSKENSLEAAVDELYEEIDEIIGDYSNLFVPRGMMVYAWEIYQYTQKLKDVQQTIFAWRPNRKTYYWVSTELGLYDSNDEKEKQLFDKITVSLYLDGYGDDFIKI